MNISDIISDSIKYPSSNWGKVLILGVICIASILVIPIFLVYGYVFRIIKATLAGMDELPEFDEIGEMFIDGLKILVVSIVYAIPVWIIAAIIGLITGAGAGTTSASLDPTMVWAIVGSNIVFIIVALIVGLVEIMAIVNMAYYNGELGAAFRFSEILDRIAQIGWGKYIVTYIIIAVIAFIGFLIGMLTMIILIGFLLLPLIIVPYIAMFSSRAIALLYASTEEGVASSEEAVE
jgi:hypothetical protein